MALVTDAQINALRTIAYKGLISPFDLYRRHRHSNEYGESGTGDWVLIESGMGWLRQANKPKSAEQAGLREGSEEVFRFHTEVGSTAQNGDRVLMNGLYYEVVGVDHDETISIFRTMLLRRSE